MARGDKPYLRKSTDRKAQIRKAFVQFSGLICALRSVDFSGKVYHPEPPHAQSLFLFPIVFGINSFQQCRQQDLSVVDFVNKLKRLAEPCKFDAHYDRALRNLFISGIRCLETRKEILALPESKGKNFADVYKLERNCQESSGSDLVIRRWRPVCSGARPIALFVKFKMATGRAHRTTFRSRGADSESSLLIFIPGTSDRRRLEFLATFSRFEGVVVKLGEKRAFGE